MQLLQSGGNKNDEDDDENWKQDMSQIYKAITTKMKFIKEPILMQLFKVRWLLVFCLHETRIETYVFKICNGVAFDLLSSVLNWRYV
jgi:hypothetical protein